MLPRSSLPPVVLAIGLVAIHFTPLQAHELHHPFVTSNQNPFVQIRGLPAPESAELLLPQQQKMSMQLEVANHFTVNEVGAEAIILDGETRQANLRWRVGLAHSLQVGLDIPYISHQSGGLDPFIEDWHAFFGLADGGRADYPQNQLMVEVRNDEQTSAALTDSGAGFGDVSMHAAYQLANDESRAWAVKADMTLPTGNAEELRGGETTDIALALAMTDRTLWARRRMMWHVSGGVLWLAADGVLAEQKKDWAVFGSTTLSWQPWSTLSLKLQLDGHTALYDSALTELGTTAMQLVMGGAVGLGKKWSVDVAVSEDIMIDTAPDVVFHLGLNRAVW